MIVCYLDSSAWVKRYVAEPGSHFVKALFSGDAYALACSSLGPVELTAALARKRKAGELSEARALRLRNRLQQDWLRFYNVPVLESVIDLATHLADEHSLRGGDAIHLASAMLLRPGSAAAQEREEEGRVNAGGTEVKLQKPS